MNFLYAREENESEVIITYTNYALYFWVSMVFVFFVTVSTQLETIYLFVSSAILLIISMYQVLAMWRPNEEIRKAMKKGNVEISGSKLSLKNPLVIKIKK